MSNQHGATIDYTKDPKELPVTVLLSSKYVAKILKVSESDWLKMHDTGKVPHPIQQGGRIFWRFDEITSWLKVGRPTRDKWDQIKNNCPDEWA